MVRTKIPSVLATTPSRGNGKGKKRRGEEEGEVQRKKKKIGNHIFKVLFNINVKAYERFKNVYDEKKVLKGRVYDFHGLGNYPGNVDLDVTKWIITQGWKDFFSYQGPTYPRLVQVLMTNYSPSTKKSWIGKVELDLSPQSIRDTLGLEFNEDEEEEEEFVWPRKEELFNDLAKCQLNRPYVYLPSHLLGLDLKIAHNMVYNMIHPKLGSSDQVPKKDARILWALERGKRLDLAQIMSDHLSFVKSNPKVPLPYGMYFTKFFERYHIDVSKEQVELFKDLDIINLTIVRRMGFRMEEGEWVYKRGKGREAPHPHITEEGRDGRRRSGRRRRKRRGKGHTIR